MAVVKVLAVGCSPRKSRTTVTGLEAALAGARSAGADVRTELVELAGLKIDGALAILPAEPGQGDDFAQVEKLLADPELGGLIIGTPVYFATVSALCKAFLDRCAVFRKSNGLRNVVGGALAVGAGRNGGQETTVQAIHAWMLYQDMVIVGDGGPLGRLGAMLWSADEDVSKDSLGLESARLMGKRIGELALALRGAGKR